MSVLDQLNEIATLAERGEEVMEMCIAVGQQAARASDANRAAIGALAEVLCRRYSEGELATFAKNIGVKVRTVSSYRFVVRYYSYAHVCSLLEQGAAWSLLRETAQAYPDDPAAADAFIETALDQHMTIEEAERALAQETGREPKPSLADELAAEMTRLRTACEFAIDELMTARRGLFEYSNYLIGEGYITDALDAENGRVYRAAQAIRDALTVRVVAAHGGSDAAGVAHVG